MQTYIALLRGVNVGGKNLVPMAGLREMLADLGFEDPKTLLQSGNAVFRSPRADPTEMEDLLRRETKARLGVDPEYFVRTSAEWGELIAANPFADEAQADPSHLLVVALKQPANAETVARLQAAVHGPERIQAVDRQLYVVFPDGIGRSKLLSTPGWKKLGGVGTGRNWNTVLRLRELAESL